MRVTLFNHYLKKYLLAFILALISYGITYWVQVKVSYYEGRGLPATMNKGERKTPKKMSIPFVGVKQS